MAPASFEDLMLRVQTADREVPPRNLFQVVRGNGLHWAPPA